MLLSSSARPLALALLVSCAAAQPTWAETRALDRCNRAQFRVLLDVGHTAEVPGATSARGVTEYDFNLRLTKVIRDKMVEAGFARTALMVTAGPSRPGLMKRVSFGNRAPADLFLSIHHDSVPDRFKATWEYEGKQREFSDRFKGHSIFVSNDNIEYRASLQFAHLLGEQLKARDLHYTPHYKEPFMGSRQRLLVDADAGVYRYDQLIVLRKSLMPAVLLEAGSIINRDEEVAMASPERQGVIADAVTDAVAQFCAARSRPAPHGPAKPDRPAEVSAEAKAVPASPRR
jgi:N-acetylmuramoyl-L-alanine amidase